MKRSILIRTDARADIGTGHLMRCLAFAQECKGKGHEPLFVLSMETPLIERLENEGMTIMRIDAERGSSNDAAKTLAIAGEHNAEWIVTDGYAFDAAYGRKLRDAGYKVLMVDDYAHLPAACLPDRQGQAGLSSYECDVLLNQNIDATETMYAGKADAELLLGPSYALLRKEFLSRTDRTRAIPKVATNILVTLGGGDPENATSLILRALDQIDAYPLSVTAIAGSENPHKDALKKIVAGSHHQISLLENVTDMPSLMAEADIAIAAAGSTSWELLFMGLPFVTGILAENQAGIAEELGKRKLAVNIGWYKKTTPASLADAILQLLTNPEDRKRMSEAGKKTVDGRGAERVLKAMLSHS